MDKEHIILLKDFKFGRCALVNQYLIDSGLSNDLRVVLAEYEYTTQWGTNTETCLGLEPLNERAEFLWLLKGDKKLVEKLKEYET